ncbi:hypothetical protein BJY04DRAFT_128669 [Aspergillus karnatakaensis]|uniref:Zn(II)2Cys6 transcription factor domain-containing protein n=1 Tax=Aspergillus karnatakaensis TaxID=1810916 RepID=UPI003CCDB344
MPTRRTHKKSRHGCKACKARRVKCDEIRPVCGNCSQREEPCEYVTDASYIWAVDEPPVQRTRRRRRPRQQDKEDVSYIPGSPFRLLDTLGGAQPSTPLNPALDITQLKLLVNWQHETCQYFSRDTETRIVWQIYLVEEALKIPSLMHGILALSALHLALSEPTQDQASWLELATAHKGQALQALREGLSCVTSDNARALMGLSALVVAYAFGAALTEVSDVDRPSLEALNNVFVLCRGVQQITSQSYSFLRQSNFAPLFTPGTPAVEVPDHVKQSLDHLDRLNSELLHQGDHDAATYAHVISAMSGLSGHAFAQPNSMTIVAGWAIRVSPEYLAYLQDKEPFALVVHAHYCAFLHLARGNCFLQYWGRSVLRDIVGLLDESWKPHIAWPIEEVFGEDTFYTPMST